VIESSSARSAGRAWCGAGFHDRRDGGRRAFDPRPDPKGVGGLLHGDLVDRCLDPSDQSDRYLRYLCSHLAYNMLAFRWHLTPDAVRYRVGDAKKRSTAASPATK
jgi:hypothetical protein